MSKNAEALRNYTALRGVENTTMGIKRNRGGPIK